MVLLTLFAALVCLILGLVFIGVTAMLMIFVIPKFESIFKDFGIQMPAVTVAMIDLCRVSWPWVPLLLAVLLIALIVNTISSGWSGACGAAG